MRPTARYPPIEMLYIIIYIISENNRMAMSNAIAIASAIKERKKLFKVLSTAAWVEKGETIRGKVVARGYFHYLAS